MCFHEDCSKEGLKKQQEYELSQKPVWTEEQCKRNAASIRIEEEHNRRLSKREQSEVVKACVEQGWRSNEYFN